MRKPTKKSFVFILTVFLNLAVLASCPSAQDEVPQASEKIPMRFPFRLDTTLSLKEFIRIAKKTDSKAVVKFEEPSGPHTKKSEIEKDSEGARFFISARSPMLAPVKFKSYQPKEEMDVTFGDSQLMDLTLTQMIKKKKDICSAVMSAYKDAIAFVQTSYAVGSEESGEVSHVGDCLMVGGRNGIQPMKLPAVKWTSPDGKFVIDLHNPTCFCGKDDICDGNNGTPVACLFSLMYELGHSDWADRQNEENQKYWQEQHNRDNTEYQKTKINL